MIQFYCPDIEASGELPDGESAHCCRVLRMREGDRIQVVDGQGFVYDCEIIDAHPKHTGVSILSRQKQERHWQSSITLAVAPTKNFDRMEWLVEKAIEIGVDRIAFIKCDRSERKQVKDERVMKIAVSAMKQSLKARLPELDANLSFREFVTGCDAGQRFIAYCNDSVERKEFAREYDSRQSMAIIIGPEGDFSGDEVKLAMEKGFIPVTLGNTRLRTETAALYALAAAHTLQSIND